MARVVAILLLFAALSAAVMTWLVYEGYISVPERDNPFLPLDVRAEPGPLTPWKFWRATHDPHAVWWHWKLPGCNSSLSQTRRHRRVAM
ncbi:hypothetical protein AB3X96_35415 [Paraburkholderia sp. BR13439]|uniref:hypothetical protein n=1 Tax=Paraburkholderia TaxID=1822464 RepID=UPI0034CF97E0